MNIKEFTIFHYKWFACLKDCVFWLILFVITPSPLSDSLLFNSLILFLSPSPSLSFWRFLCIFFFRKRKDSFSPIISSFIPIFHLFVPLLSLSPLLESKTSFDIFIPRLSRFPPFSHFFFLFLFRRGRSSFRLNFSKILKVDNISREESVRKREREEDRGLFTAAAIARVSTASNPRNTWDLIDGGRKGGEGRGERSGGEIQ